MKRPLPSNGFSLLELIIGFGLATILILAVGSAESQLSTAASFINYELTNQQGLQQVFQRMVTEVRSMQPSNLGSYPIEAAGTSSLTFYSDVDEDGLVERVRYYFTSSTFVRAVLKPTGNPLVYVPSSETTTTVVTGVLPASSTFYYYDSGYTGAEAPMSSSSPIINVRVVRVDLYADLSPSIAPQPTYYTNTITIRNLKSN